MPLCVFSSGIGSKCVIGRSSMHSPPRWQLTHRKWFDTGWYRGSSSSELISLSKGVSPPSRSNIAVLCLIILLKREACFGTHMSSSSGRVMVRLLLSRANRAIGDSCPTDRDIPICFPLLSMVTYQLWSPPSLGGGISLNLRSDDAPCRRNTYNKGAGLRLSYCWR